MIKTFLSALLLFVFYADEPKLIKVQLSKTVSALVPETFTLMTDDELASKYPSSRKPVAMYVSNDKQVDFGMNIASQKFPGSDLAVMKDFYKANLFALFNNVEILKEDIEKVNGKEFIVFEFVSEVQPDKKSIAPQSPVKKYSYIQYTLVNDFLLIFNFSCPERMKSNWENTAEKIMGSIKISKK